MESFRRSKPHGRHDVTTSEGAPITVPLPRIAVIGTGGTISSLGASRLDVLEYPDLGQKLYCEALLDGFPEARLIAEPAPVTFRQVRSTATGPAEWPELRDLSHRMAGEDPAIAGFRDPAWHRDARGHRALPQSDARHRGTGGA